MRLPLLQLALLIFAASTTRSAYLWKPVSWKCICHKRKPVSLFCHLLMHLHLQTSRQTGSLETLYSQDLSEGQSWSQSDQNDPDPGENDNSGKPVPFSPTFKLNTKIKTKCSSFTNEKMFISPVWWLTQGWRFCVMFWRQRMGQRSSNVVRNEARDCRGWSPGDPTYWPFSHHGLGCIDFNTATTNCPVGMYFLIHP